MVIFNLPGGIPVYTFSFLVALGAFVGLGWATWQASPKEAPQRLEAGVWALLGALLGGRAAYVALNWAHYRDRLWESAQVYLGGLSWPGALAGGLLALGLYAVALRRPLGRLADSLFPLLAALAVSAWLGCWLDGCAYGWTTSAWWGVLARDEWGALAKRWPLQLLGALAILGLFWLLERYASRKSPPPGLQASLGLLGLCVISLALSMLRADPAPLWRGLRLESWSALAFAGLAGLVAAGIQARAGNDRRRAQTRGERRD